MVCLFTGTRNLVKINPVGSVLIIVVFRTNTLYSSEYLLPARTMHGKPPIIY